MKRYFSYLIVALVAVAAGWFAANHLRAPAAAPAETNSSREVLYYQSPMHPWIRSDKPGKCTICGMNLVAVHSGDSGFQAEANVVALPQNSINVVGIETVEARRGDLVRTLRVTGLIEDDDTRHRYITSYVDGRVEKLFVNYVGAEVKKGEPLAQLYSPELLSAQKEYLLMLKSPAVTNLGNARQRLMRLGLTETQIDNLTTKPEEWRSEILAPMSGVVVSRSVYEGQYVKTGDQLFEIADFSTMWFLFDAYEQDLPLLKVGNRVEVTTAANPGRVFEAAVSFIDPNFNEESRATKVRVEIPNPVKEGSDIGTEGREIPHRVTAEGIVKSVMPSVLSVPRSAVLRTGVRDVVFIDQGGGAYKLTEVTIGRRGDDAWEILDGLKEGDKVVVRGNLLLDAQAQLQREARPEAPSQSSPETKRVPVKLGEISKEELNRVVSLTQKASEALAADDFKTYQSFIAELISASEAASPELAKLFHEVAHETTLEKTRERFQVFSTAVADLVLTHRNQMPGLASVRVFECPMPLVPGPAKWVQSGTETRNPFYGAEMLTCGSEVEQP